eukprot:TRINITY_DN9457_c1_g1_i4.p1 TRINITY_DN9457_c1_g1~~TRINITY_DN9457_c1_g1_i4.p1  ORF type:complete len:486 (+),score=87.70 TRINITY_DN9457_c1_g1_i4:65-1522(+)
MSCQPSIKLSFADQIRRLPSSAFNLEDWGQFCSQIEELLRHPLPGIRGDKGPFRLTYVDDEGETITIYSADELVLAASLSPVVLHLFISRKLGNPDKLRCVRQAPEPVTVPSGLPNGSLLRLSNNGSTVASAFFIHHLPCGVSFLLVKDNPQHAVRVVPGGAQVDFGGRRGPFARFQVTSEGDRHLFFNPKTEKYLQISDSQLTPSSSPVGLLADILPASEIAKESTRKVQFWNCDGVCVPECYFVKALPDGILCFAPETSPNGTLRINPLTHEIDYKGRAGPFAQFKVIGDDGNCSVALFNKKTGTFLKVVDGKLVTDSASSPIWIKEMCLVEPGIKEPTTGKSKKETKAVQISVRAKQKEEEAAQFLQKAEVARQKALKAKEKLEKAQQRAAKKAAGNCSSSSESDSSSNEQKIAKRIEKVNKRDQKAVQLEKKAKRIEKRAHKLACKAEKIKLKTECSTLKQESGSSESDTSSSESDVKAVM